MKDLDFGRELIKKKIPLVSNSPGVYRMLDKKDIKLGIELKIDWFALSFVRTADDITSFLKLYEKSDTFIPVIAKIEKPEAIKNAGSVGVEIFKTRKDYEGS